MTVEAIATQGGALAASLAWGALASSGVATSPSAAIRAVLAANATYAWLGDDATLAAWPDVVASLNAAPGGSGTTLSTINTRPSVSLNGSGIYRAAASSVFGGTDSEWAIVAVCAPASAGNRSVVGAADYAAPSDYTTLTLRSTPAIRVARRGASAERTVTSSSGYSAGQALAITATSAGATATVRVNGAQVASGAFDGGAISLTAQIGIGGTAYPDAFIGDPFVGDIALVALVSGADYAARALAIEAAALTYYDISGLTGQPIGLLLGLTYA